MYKQLKSSVNYMQYNINVINKEIKQSNLFFYKLDLL